MRSNMSTYHFDTDDAEKYGIDGAIVLYNFKHWIQKNIANKKNFYDIQSRPCYLTYSIFR